MSERQGSTGPSSPSNAPTGDGLRAGHDRRDRDLPRVSAKTAPRLNARPPSQKHAPSFMAQVTLPGLRLPRNSSGRSSSRFSRSCASRRESASERSCAGRGQPRPEHDGFLEGRVFCCVQSQRHLRREAKRTMVYIYRCAARLCPGHRDGWARATGRIQNLPPRCPRCGDVAALVKFIESDASRSRAPNLTPAALVLR